MSLLCSSVSEIFPQSNDSLARQERVELDSGCLLTLRKTAEGRTITGQGQNQDMFGFLWLQPIRVQTQTAYDGLGSASAILFSDLKSKIKFRFTWTKAAP